MKNCELCKSPAAIYCDSDQATLCWSCDAKVHSANFIVARHSRSLLCHVCQSPTPWTASGERLAPSTVSVCEKCVVDGVSEEDDDDREESHGDNDEDEEYDGEDEFDLEDDDDNQVVPWSSALSPPPASSSSSEEFQIGDVTGGSVKRKRRNVPDLSSEDDYDCSSVRRSHPRLPPPALLHSPPSSPEIRHRNTISGENKPGAVVGTSKATRAVGLDVDSS